MSKCRIWPPVPLPDWHLGAIGRTIPSPCPGEANPLVKTHGGCLRLEIRCGNYGRWGAMLLVLVSSWGDATTFGDEQRTFTAFSTETLEDAVDRVERAALDAGCVLPREKKEKR